jgi:hypothetical protein
MPLLDPWEIGVLEALGTDGISGEIAAPANGSYTVFVKAPFACTITGLSSKTSAGTLTCAVTVNAVAVDGLTAVAVTTASVQTPTTQFTTTAQVAAGDIIALTVSAVAGAANFAYVVDYRRPNSP